MTTQDTEKFPPASSEALAKHPLHTWRVGRVLFGVRRSDDGLWHDGGRILPWLCFLPWSDDNYGGGKVKAGAWIFAALWSRDNG